MTIPIRVISMKRSTDRRAAITAHLAGYGLTPRFFDAVDGRAMTPAEIAAMRVGKNPRYGTPLKPGEIGAGTSVHRVCLEIAAGPDPFVCLLEDDAILLPQAMILLDPAYLATLPRFDMLRFGHGGMMRPGFAVKYAERDGFSIVAPVFPLGLMAAQVLTREGAARIAAGFVPLHTAPDTHMFNDGYVRGMRLLQTVPTLHIEPTVPSTISTSAESKWPTVRPWGRVTTKWARAGAVLRNMANYAQAWGWMPLFCALLRREGKS